MILSLKALLSMAEARNIAVGAFNVTTLEGIQAVLVAAEETGQPVIVQFANAAHGRYISLEVIGPIMVSMADKAKVPVCVHLDHGESLAEIKSALTIGFSSVMYDGSMLSYEQNVANTKAVVEMSAKYGAGVEAEIGCMGREEFASAGGNKEEEEVKSCYTDPQQARQFVLDTGVDALACSFGTVHGIYLKAPKLDVDRVKTIRNLTGIPVVMHGGSGLSDEDFKNCINNGVRKINFYTYAVKDAGEYVKSKVNAEKGYVYYHDIAVWGLAAMKETYVKTISVFSNLK